MPANKIVVNGHFEYIIEDSKMEEVLEYLSKVSVEAKSLILPDQDRQQGKVTPVDYLSNKYPKRGSATATYSKTEVLQMLEEYKGSE